MATKQEAKDWLKKLGVDPDNLIKALTANEESDIAIPAGVFLTEQQLTERDNNNLANGKKVGEKDIIGILNKEIKSVFGVELNTDRIGKSLEGLQTHLAKNSGEEKIQQLTKQVQDLSNDKTALSEEVNTYKACLTLFIRHKKSHLLGGYKNVVLLLFCAVEVWHFLSGCN